MAVVDLATNQEREEAESWFPSLQFKAVAPSRSDLSGGGQQLFFKGVKVECIEKFSYTVTHGVNDVNRTELRITLLGIQVEQAFDEAS